MYRSCLCLLIISVLAQTGYAQKIKISPPKIPTPKISPPKIPTPKIPTPKFNPFDKNNGINQAGRDIDKGRLKIMTPRLRPDPASGVTVMSYSVDPDGYIHESSRGDRKPVNTGRRADIKWYKSGKAYWYYAGKKYPAYAKYNKQQQQQQQQQLAPQKRFVGINTIVQNGTPEELLFTLHFQPVGAPRELSKAFKQRMLLPPNRSAVWTIPSDQGVSIVNVQGARFYRLMVEAINPDTGRKYYWGPNSQRPGLLANKVTVYERRNRRFIDQYINLHIGVN